MTARFLLCLLLLGCGRGEDPPTADSSIQLPRMAIETADSQSVSAQKIKPPPKLIPIDCFGPGAGTPAFKGGNDSLIAFLSRYAQWPEGLPLSITGKVYVRVMVEENGEISSSTVLKSLHPLADAEALRLAGLLSGHFVPTGRKSKADAVSYIIPITFIAE